MAARQCVLMNDSPTPAEIAPPPSPQPDPTSRASELLGRLPTPEELAVLGVLEQPPFSVGIEPSDSTPDPGASTASPVESAPATPWETLDERPDPVPILTAWLSDPAWTRWSASHRQRAIMLPTGVSQPVPMPLPAPQPEATVPPEGADATEPAPSAAPSAAEPSVPVRVRSVALCGSSEEVRSASNGVDAGRRDAWSAVLRLACWGAAPLGSVIPAAFSGEAVRGWSEVCAALRVPVVPGDVALPAPASCVPGVCVAIIEEPGHQTPSGFVHAGDVILLLGYWTHPDVPLRDLGGSAYLHHRSFPEPGTPAPVDAEAAGVLCGVVRGLVHEGVVRSALDCGRGGLAYCLAECCLLSVPDPGTGAPLGARIELPQPTAGDVSAEGNAGSETQPKVPRLDVLLFGESPHRVVISVACTDAGRVLKQCRIMGVPAVRLGTVGGDALVLGAGDQEFRVPVATSGTVGSTPSTVSPP